MGEGIGPTEEEEEEEEEEEDEELCPLDPLLEEDALTPRPIERARMTAAATTSARMSTTTRNLRLEMLGLLLCSLMMGWDSSSMLLIKFLERI